MNGERVCGDYDKTAAWQDVGEKGQMLSRQRNRWGSRRVSVSAQVTGKATDDPAEPIGGRSIRYNQLRSIQAYAILVAVLKRGEIGKKALGEFSQGLEPEGTVAGLGNHHAVRFLSTASAPQQRERCAEITSEVVAD